MPVTLYERKFNIEEANQILDFINIGSYLKNKKESDKEGSPFELYNEYLNMIKNKAFKDNNMEQFPRYLTISGVIEKALKSMKEKPEIHMSTLITPQSADVVLFVLALDQSQIKAEKEKIRDKIEQALVSETKADQQSRGVFHSFNSSTRSAEPSTSYSNTPINRVSTDTESKVDSEKSKHQSPKQPGK